MDKNVNMKRVYILLLSLVIFASAKSQIIYVNKYVRINAGFLQVDTCLCGQWYTMATRVYVDNKPAGGGGSTLTIDAPLTGVSYNGSAPITIGIDTNVIHTSAYNDGRYSPIGSGGGSGVNIYNADSTFTGDRIANLDGHSIFFSNMGSGSFRIGNGIEDLFEVSTLRGTLEANDGTAQSRMQIKADGVGNDVTFEIHSNNGVDPQIGISGDAALKSIIYTAGTQTFNIAATGILVVNDNTNDLLHIDKAGNQTYIQAADGVSASSFIQFDANGAGSNVKFEINATSGQTSVYARGDAVADTLGFLAHTHSFNIPTTGLFRVTNGSDDLLALDNTSFQSRIEANDGGTGHTRVDLHANPGNSDAYFEILSDDGINGVSINGNPQTNNVTITSGTVNASSLQTSGSAPVTSGTTKMVITDNNGQLSFGDALPKTPLYTRNQVFKPVVYDEVDDSLKYRSQTVTDPYSNNALSSTLNQWRTVKTPLNAIWTNLDYSPFQHRIAVTSHTGSANGVMTSDDGGLTWSLRTTPSLQWRGIAWSPSLRIWVAVASTGTGNRFMSSPDAITWTSRTSTADYKWRDVIWCEDVGLFVAVANTSGFTDKVATSPDGINWTARTCPDEEWSDIVYSPEKHLFVVSATSGIAGNKIMTSPDAITWTARTSADDGASWEGVTWAPELGLFVSVAYTSSLFNKRVGTSPDGITWTLQTSPSQQWLSVAWSPEYGKLVAVADGTNKNLMSSPDGINWTLDSLPVTRDWRRIYWFKELHAFYAVAYFIAASGDSLIMISRPTDADREYVNVNGRPNGNQYIRDTVTAQNLVADRYFKYANSILRSYDTTNYKLAVMNSSGELSRMYWPSITTTLAGLTDVNISSPSNGQVLTYQTSDNKWHNATASGTTVGTYASRIALTPSNGLEFFQTDDGRDAPAGRYWYLNSVWNSTRMREEDMWYYFNDYGALQANNNQDNTMYTVITGTGAGLSFTGSQDLFNSQWSTGTTTTGSVRQAPSNASTSFNTSLRASTANMYFKISMGNISALSDGTNTYTIDLGFASNANSPPSAGYFFRYDQSSSTNWLYRNGTGTVTSTGVTVATATSYIMEVFVRSDSVFYWINNTAVASEATGANTTYTVPVIRIVKSAGGTARTMDVDYVRIWARLQTTRTVY